jgi:rubrerythrin
MSIRSWKEQDYLDNIPEGYTLIELNMKEKYIIYKHNCCGNEMKKTLVLFKTRTGCNNKQCVVITRNKVVKEKYGTDNAFQSEIIKQKIKETNLKKYGCENPAQNEEVKKKYMNTQKERYGGTGLAGKETKQKAKDTIKEKYGVNNVMEIPGAKEKVSKSLLAKHLKQLLENMTTCKPLFDLTDYKGMWEEHEWQCTKCGEIFKDTVVQWRVPRCLKCYPLKGSSQMESEIVSWLENDFKLNIERNYVIECNNKKYECDILLKDFNLGIEINGLYWHSEIAGNRGEKYHLEKTNSFESKGIRIIHIWDIEWVYKQNIVKSLIKSVINKINTIIYARNCDIKKLQYSEIKEFLEENHMQGSFPSSINIGLFFNNELIQVGTFSKSRYNNNYNYELIRLCSKLDTSIIGGFSKILSYFKNNFSGSIVSYVDRRFFNGNGYLKVGFEKIGISNPNYYYTKDHKFLESRLSYQKHKLKDKLEKFDESLTEWENMQANGYDRIWDCGNYIFVLK